MNSGIYMITNIINKKIYIGSACDIKKRWKKHKQNLRNNKHHNIHLQNAWNKHGEKCFKFEILQNVSVIEHLISYEQKYLDYFKSYDKNVGYNIRILADNNLGTKRSSETKISEETKNKISLSMRSSNNHFYGKKHSAESKLKMGLKAEKHSKAKLNWEKVRNIRKLYTEGNYTNIELANMYNIHNSVVCRIINNKIWREQ
jgi:hypothetical protein